MKFAVVEKAGLLDPHTNEHKPGKIIHYMSEIFIQTLLGTKLATPELPDLNAINSI